MLNFKSEIWVCDARTKTSAICECARKALNLLHICAAHTQF